MQRGRAYAVRGSRLPLDITSAFSTHHSVSGSCVLRHCRQCYARVALMVQGAVLCMRIFLCQGSEQQVVEAIAREWAGIRQLQGYGRGGSLAVDGQGGVGLYMTNLAIPSDCAELLKHAKPFLCLIVHAGLQLLAGVLPHVHVQKAMCTEQR
ncbi:hypothetical protein COO60DRAFT_1090832 [Scenedesmus sp. NREL 46B-D3]|nr:hypothetical protein COO60DRAFT_1090832 [Scenedesmus sp. NREL 46B-D3]